MLRNKNNEQIYEYQGGTTYKNIFTGKVGNVDDETAAKVFKLPVNLNLLVKKNPEVLDLIKNLGLKALPNTFTE